ncbi:MAG: helix-turn-helix transcriptional regulator [Fibrobacter sp.]|nr:helix-turn-helix transcriptional regulator [Fibrobacter sp.]
MAFRYKLDVVQALKDKGFSTYRIRKEKLFSESTLQAFRENQTVSWETLEQVCRILQCQPGDLVEFYEA